MKKKPAVHLFYLYAVFLPVTDHRFQEARILLFFWAYISPFHKAYRTFISNETRRVPLSTHDGKLTCFCIRGASPHSYFLDRVPLVSKQTLSSSCEQKGNLLLISQHLVSFGECFTR